MNIDRFTEYRVESLISSVSLDANHIPYDQMLLRRLVSAYLDYLKNTYDYPFMTLYEFSLCSHKSFEYYADLLMDIESVLLPEDN